MTKIAIIAKLSIEVLATPPQFTRPTHLILIKAWITGQISHIQNASQRNCHIELKFGPRINHNKRNMITSKNPKMRAWLQSMTSSYIIRFVAFWRLDYYFLCSLFNVDNVFTTS